MIVEYRTNPDRQRITVVVGEVLNGADLLEVIERQASDGTWHYDVLYDERRTVTQLSSNDLRGVIARIAVLTHLHGRRGRVAIVSRSPGEIGLARLYGAWAEQVRLDADAFDDVASAEAWLAGPRP